MTAEAGASDVCPDEIERQLERIIGSLDFEGSDRIRRFLRFIVEETLSGRQDAIKAYNIALAVFGRDHSFDPNGDPIVRIEAGRLRRALERYYLTAGAHDPIRITVPKGGYVPVFERIKPAPAAAAGPPVPRPRLRGIAYAAAGALVLAAFLMVVKAVWPGLGEGQPGDALRPTDPADAGHAAVAPRAAAGPGPSILVLPFANLSGDPANDHIADGLTAALVAALTRFDQLLVYGVETGLHYGPEPDLAEIGDEHGVTYALTGMVRLAPQQVRVTGTLISVPDGRHLWSRSFAHQMTDANALTIQDEVADQVARILGDTYGVIFQEEMDGARDAPPTAWSAYRCVLGSYRYWRRPMPWDHAVIRTCLERAVADDPDYAEAWANLALIHIDEYRYGFNPRPDAPPALERALAAARRAVSLAPDGVRGHQALHLVYWLQHDIENSFAAAERALALNPHNTEVLAGMGLRYIVLGDVERGMPLLDEAFARNPQQNDFYLLGYVIFHYARREYEAALTYARRVDMPGCWCSHVALAAIYGQLGRRAAAHPHVEAILAMDPDFVQTGVEELQRRNLPPDLIDHFVEGLRKAGLPVVPRDAAEVDG